MEYIHIKNIEEYNPGYKDRNHIWAKVYWKIFIDEDYQALSEIDRHRLIGLIVFETYNQKPVALTPVNLALMGWNTKKHPISLTLQMLHKFIDTRNENVTQSRVEKRREEKNIVATQPTISPEDFIKNLKANPVYKGVDIDTELEKIDKWLLANPHRKKTERFILRWLSRADKTLETTKETKLKPADPNCKLCKDSPGFVYNPSTSKTEICSCRIKSDKPNQKGVGE